MTKSISGLGPRWRVSLSCAAVVCAFTSCKDKKNTVEPDPKASDAQPTFRLDDRAEPTRYRVRLDLDPSKDQFTGEVEIEMRIARPTSEIWMHGRDLDVSEAWLERAGAPAVRGTVETGESFLLGFRFESVIAPGDAVLRVKYTGKVVGKDGVGIFGEKDNGEQYIFTHFEPFAARRAFPCFDEPRWKVPWNITLDIPAGQVAVANAPVASEENLGAKKQRVVFAETRPLPSYLVAFAVGPFEFVDAGLSSSGVPLRIVVPKGRTADAAYAAKVTPEVLASLEKYFGRPYPYQKLDTLVVPRFHIMEHPGLITFSARDSIWTPDQDSFVRRRFFALAQMHEVGHMWFGNLVTMPWWDELWLKESFATWLENRVLAEMRPSWDVTALSMVGKELAISLDVLAISRRIRHPVDDMSAIVGAFDPITYFKGEAVIRMFEGWVGPTIWQKALQVYLEKYAWKTATSEDFLSVATEVSGKDVGGPFNTFIDQNGLPLVTMKLRCEANLPPTLNLTQARYLPLGSKAERERRWQIPVCVTHSEGEACTLLTEQSSELRLGAAGEKCPGWVNPNKGGLGYYRSFLDEKTRGTLASAELSVGERLSHAGDTGALLQAGLIEPGEAIRHAAALASDPHPSVGLAGVVLAKKLMTLSSDSTRAKLAKVLTSAFAPALARVGLSARDNEKPEIGELRAELIMLLAGELGHPATRKQVNALAQSRLTKGKAIDASIAAAVLAMAARYGDRPLFDAMTQQAVGSSDKIARDELLSALGHFRGDLAKEALALTMSEKIDGRAGKLIIEAAASWPETRGTAVDFTVANIDKLKERLASRQLVGLPRAFNDVCEKGRRDQLEKLFTTHTASLRGGERQRRQMLEKIDLCIAFRETQGPALEKALATGR